jgi:hypothetical protein
MRGAKSRALSYAPGAHRRAASRLLAPVDRRQLAIDRDCCTFLLY